MKTRLVVSLIVMVSLFSAVTLVSNGNTESKNNIKPTRVGVYDSRAIAVAYVHSSLHKQQFEEKMKEMKKAKAAGDEKKIQELTAWGRQQQQKQHLQGFGAAPVQDLLKPVQGQLAAVAKTAGVDIILSKWQIDYQSGDAEYTDITDALVALYKPNEKTLKIIHDLKKWKPLPEAEILKHKD